MQSIKMRGVCAAVTGALLFGFGANAMADSTTDIVNALIAKGVLTEEEGALINKGREGEAAGQAKAIKKAGKLSISDAVDNATVYGDVRVRYEDRSGDGLAGGKDGSSAAAGSPYIAVNNGTVSANASLNAWTGSAAGPFASGAVAPGATYLHVGSASGSTNPVAASNVTERRERARYKITMGVKTNAGNWYSDLAFAMGNAGRSDNATFGNFNASTAPNSAGNLNNKETLFVKRAMVGYKATDWLTLEAGRMENPLYTTPMVWDADLTFEGLAEKVKYKVGDNLDLFGTAAQMQYLGDKKSYFLGSGSSTTTNELLAFQGGARYAFDDRTSAKVALTYTTMTHGSQDGSKKFTPGLGINNLVNNYEVNDLDTIEIPAEINFMAMPNVGVRVFGDYVYNTSGSDRFNAAVAAAAAGDRAAITAAGNDDTAWMLGVAVGSAKDLKAFESNKMVAGDWSARIWYQDVGVYSIDQNAVDSDFFDSRVNMKGTTFKAQYNVQDNVLLNVAYGHATRKNDALGTPTGSGNDISGINVNSFDLFQFDVTYKF